ncbi:MAG TPA: right-handed parallel beta-helix repeat-containing protein [Steroidobacteraceae bacterium]|nr:right-handed parallel beta-helix repeat-containing protein [Steroidobacteraceae bacterium]
MKRLYVSLWLAAWFLGANANAQNRDIYVSRAGHWFGPGSMDRPLSSIQKAVDRARAGDVVHVMAGQYPGFEVWQSGTSQFPITIKAEGNVRLSNPAGYGIYIHNASHLVIDGFTIDHTGLKGIAARDATPDEPMRNIVIRNNTIVETQEEGLYLSEVSESLIENNTIRDVGLARIETTGHGIYLANAGSKNTVIRRNTIEGPHNVWGQAIHLNGDESVGGDGLIARVTIESNRISGFNNGLSLDGVQDTDIRNNVIIDTHHHGIRGFCIDGAAGPANLRIVNNTIRAPHGNAIKLTQEAATSIIFNNILVGGEGATSLERTDKLAANLTQFAVSTDFKPDAVAQKIGLAEFASVIAPARDFTDAVRRPPFDVGALARDEQ